ncbi:protein GAMETOPHYTE DEFECTIVE 1-like [Castanea sativa]|uniref:protein GAMETOPHYTE DEFECTIVE 1-like n=1 Tax=Castanea sativa TaxID=21020 RepID=UPI003F64F112
MELGYIGIAYNGPIKGVMSDNDRCSISLLLCQSPPRPPQCSTRLTVCVENHSQALALNSGNPILKTYDLVAVKPLDQNALDDACDKSEIDIIAIDFSERLPFRLKQTKVKAAIEVCFFNGFHFIGFVDKKFLEC